MGFGGFVKNFALGGLPNALSGGAITRAITDDPGAEEERERKRLMREQSTAATQMADQAQRGYADLGRQGNAAIAGLQRLATGQDSFSAEQLKQALGQQLAGQRSLAAGASPRNAAMAARTAAIQSARLGAGMAGQQALAGIQERNQAQQQLGSLIGQMRGQDLQASLDARKNALTGLGAYTTPLQPEKGFLEKYGPAIQGGLQTAMMFSDRRLKKRIRGGDKHANRAIEGLQAYVYKYKDGEHGCGDQLGIMAQDLERAGIKSAVIDTPGGKAVHGAKLAGANTAMIAALGRRVRKLEGRK